MTGNTFVTGNFVKFLVSIHHSSILEKPNAGTFGVGGDQSISREFTQALGEHAHCKKPAPPCCPKLGFRI